MKKFFSMLLVLMMVVSLVVGCAGGEEPAEEPVEEPSEEGVEEPAEEPDEPLKVALLTPGPINDGGWSASAYEGLLMIEEEYGAEIAYSENVAMSDHDEVFRLYADAGFDIVFGHGAEFGDAATRVAPDFLDVTFCINSSNITQEPNVFSIQNDNAEQGFLMGAVAGVVTETGIVGGIGGMDIPSISNAIRGYEAGAKYVNPDVDVRTILTGSFDDAGKAKEVANAMLDAGADIIMVDVSQASMGGIEACKDRDAMIIGAIMDQAYLAPDNMITSGVANMPLAFKKFVDKYLEEGDVFEAGSYRMGVDDDVIYLAPYYKFEDKLTDEQKATIQKVYDDIRSGDLVVREYGDFKQ